MTPSRNDGGGSDHEDHEEEKSLLLASTITCASTVLYLVVNVQHERPVRVARRRTRRRSRLVIVMVIVVQNCIRKINVEDRDAITLTLPSQEGSGIILCKSFIYIIIMVII